MPKPNLFTGDTKTAVIRYQVRDVDRACAFYTDHLGFQVVQRSGPVIAIVARGDLHLILSGPESSGARPLPDGRKQEPGGWNRIVLYVESIEATIASLRAAGARFRNPIEVGPGGKQIQVDDLDGNPIELHEAPREQAGASVEQVVRAHDEAWARGDVDGLLALFADDATVESPMVLRLTSKPSGVCRGREEIRELVQAAMQRGVPWNGHAPAIIRGTTAVIEFKRATPEGEQPHSVDVMEIVDGKIQQLRAYLGWRASVR